MIKETIIETTAKPISKKRSKINYDDFCKIINYNFKRAILLKHAITHSSSSKNKLENNQRLEFLGDRVLGLSIAKILYESFPLEDEGSLAIRHSSLVSARALASIADQISISSILELSSQELKRQGYKNRNILADSTEALLGAIYLDSDFETVFKVIKKLWCARIDQSKIPIKDCKTKLQEYTQKKYNSPPEYVLENKEGLAHAPIFTVSTTVGEIKETASAGSKRDAEHLVAAETLKRLDLLNKEELEELELYKNTTTDD